MDESLIRVGMWAEVGGKLYMLKRYGEAPAGQWNSRWLGKWVWPRNFTDGGRTSDPSLMLSVR